MFLILKVTLSPKSMESISFNISSIFSLVTGSPFIVVSISSVLLKSIPSIAAIKNPPLRTKLSLYSEIEIRVLFLSHIINPIF